MSSSEIAALHMKEPFSLCLTEKRSDSVIPFIYGRLIVSIDLPETLSLEIRLAGAGQYPTQQYETKLLDDPSLSY
ncbi:hypothetical protein F2Q69_00043751 [Brassica cretica]|uniref:Uncharacterized protein n=1 Tax=Brassica cretica TaxID=69181 RepID=A0A8S9NPC1_BRACR|nr:hypothetical protein F2Q69_00043751 [Brassica cretica]